VTAVQTRDAPSTERGIVVGDGVLIAANVQLLTAEQALDACLRRKRGESGRRSGSAPTPDSAGE
jgi:hypothetical protein